jgi:hypothetical protein
MNADMRFGENGKRGGRPPGRKNKMHRDFLADMQAEWEEGGRAALRIVRIEQPVEFVKAYARLFPRELSLSLVDDMDVDRLDDLLEEIDARLLAAKPVPLMIEAKGQPIVEEPRPTGRQNTRRAKGAARARQTPQGTAHRG